jgi:hypothetical protein
MSSSKRHRAVVTTVTSMMLVSSVPALAAPPQNVPNSYASHNCVATSSGVLFFREHGIHLGEDVRMFAPHGGQRDYVQKALQDEC